MCVAWAVCTGNFNEKGHCRARLFAALVPTQKPEPGHIPNQNTRPDVEEASKEHPKAHRAISKSKSEMRPLADTSYFFGAPATFLVRH